MMFVPEHFRIEDREQIEGFIDDHPFATLITVSNGEIEASHLPIRRFGDGKLYGHMARANPLMKEFFITKTRNLEGTKSKSFLSRVFVLS
jgi:predicted FMN-binding regulatory protein PaiB